jgi:hypothetical protein
MERTEYLANEALAFTASRPAQTPQAGDLFAARGRVHSYRKPSLFARVLRAIGL